MFLQGAQESCFEAQRVIGTTARTAASADWVTGKRGHLEGGCGSISPFPWGKQRFRSGGTGGPVGKSSTVCKLGEGCGPTPSPFLKLTQVSPKNSAAHTYGQRDDGAWHCAGALGQRCGWGHAGRCPLDV